MIESVNLYAGSIYTAIQLMKCFKYIRNRVGFFLLNVQPVKVSILIVSLLGHRKINLY